MSILNFARENLLPIRHAALPIAVFFSLATPCASYAQNLDTVMPDITQRVAVKAIAAKSVKIASEDMQAKPETFRRVIRRETVKKSVPTQNRSSANIYSKAQTRSAVETGVMPVITPDAKNSRITMPNYVDEGVLQAR